MRKGQLTALLVFAIIFASCKFQCQVGKDADKENSNNSNNQQTTNNGDAQLLNNITLSATDVQVTSAYLTLENGERLSSDNTVRARETIKLVININGGWKEINGKVFLGASEQITSDNGTVQVETGDMFSAYTETGLDAGDAKVITLNASMDSKPAAIDYYIVNFKVWDKKGKAEISGKYNFYIK